VAPFRAARNICRQPETQKPQEKQINTNEFFFFRSEFDDESNNKQQTTILLPLA
jgi:hypothetical protein